METELIIRIDYHLYERITAYAKIVGKSVSQIVADYFVLLDKVIHQDDTEFSQITSSTMGCLRNSEVTEKYYKKFLNDTFTRYRECEGNNLKEEKETRSRLDELIGTLTIQNVEEMQDIIEGELPI